MSGVLNEEWGNHPLKMIVLARCSHSRKMVLNKGRVMAKRALARSSFLSTLAMQQFSWSTGEDDGGCMRAQL